MIGFEHQVFSEGSPGSGYGGLLALLNGLDSAQGSTATLRTPAPTRSWWMCRSPVGVGRSSSWQTVPWPSSGTDLWQGWSLIRDSSTNMWASSARRTQSSKRCSRTAHLVACCAAVAGTGTGFWVTGVARLARGQDARYWVSASRTSSEVVVPRLSASCLSRSRSSAGRSRSQSPTPRPALP